MRNWNWKSWFTCRFEIEINTPANELKAPFVGTAAGWPHGQPVRSRIPPLRSVNYETDMCFIAINWFVGKRKGSRRFLAGLGLFCLPPNSLTADLFFHIIYGSVPELRLSPFWVADESSDDKKRSKIKTGWTRPSLRDNDDSLIGVKWGMSSCCLDQSQPVSVRGWIVGQPWPVSLTSRGILFELHDGRPLFLFHCFDAEELLLFLFCSIWRVEYSQ